MVGLGGVLVEGGGEGINVDLGSTVGLGLEVVLLVVGFGGVFVGFFVVVVVFPFSGHFLHAFWQFSCIHPGFFRHSCLSAQIVH